MKYIPEDLDRLPALDDNIFPDLITAKEAEPAVKHLASLILNRNVTRIDDQRKLGQSGMRMDHDPFCSITCSTEDSGQFRLFFAVDRAAVRLPNRIQQYEVNGLVYEMCKFHAAQYTGKMKDCSDLVPTYVVMFSENPLFPSGRINTFSLRNDADGTLLSDSIHFVYIDVLNDVPKKPVEKMTDWEKWFFFLGFAKIHPNTHSDIFATLNRVIDSSPPLQAAAKVYVERCKAYQARVADGSIDAIEERGAKIIWQMQRTEEKTAAYTHDEQRKALGL